MALINSSLGPKAPPSMKECLIVANPPFGEFNLNGHKKLLASLKCGPTFHISFIKSSMHLILYLPNTFSMISLEVNGILYPSTLPYPLL